jgi:peptide/nickel transport system permease protein
MQGYLLRRVLLGLIVIWLVSVITFSTTQLAPGGLSILMYPGLDEEAIEILRRQLGLDQPVWVQYLRWLGNFVTGDLGSSFINREPVLDMIMSRLPHSLLLVAAAMLPAAIVGIPVAVVSAVRRYSLTDYVVTVATFLGISTPPFWLGILLIILFSAKLKWLPSAGMFTVGEPFSLVDRLRHLVMPAFVLGVTVVPQLTRYARATISTQLSEDYVRTARGKGLSERAVLLGHVLRNSILPVITIFAYYLPRLVGGTVVIETVFGWPGLGTLAYQGAVNRDYPVVMGVTMLVATLVVVTNIVVDLVYTALDPRIRLG